MKKILSLVALVAVIGLGACNKSKTPLPPVLENVNASLRLNETYAYTITNVMPMEMYTIVAPPAHARVSTLTDANGRTTYNYTPAQDYVGTDRIVIKTTPPASNGNMQNGCPSSNQQSEKPREHVVTINLTLTGEQ